MDMFLALKITKQINFKCGCIGEYPYEGEFADRKEWHIIPCYKHVDHIKVVELVCEDIWKRATNETKN